MARPEGETVAVDGQAVILMDDGDDVLHRPASEEGIEFDDPTKDTVDDTTDAAPAAADDDAPAAAPAATGDALPPELLKKSPAELAKMYHDLHRAYGRQGSELGDLRTLADQHLRASLAAQTAEARRRAADTGQKPEAPKAIEDADFFASPKQAIERAIAEHPEVKRLRQENEGHRAAAVATRMQQSKDAFEKAHPDAGEVLADPEFREWVGKSQIRQKMLVAADRNYDFAAGNELFGTWKEIKAARKPAAAAAKTAASQTRTAAKQAAKVPTGGNAGSAKSTGEKIYRRADLIRLQINDPDRYEAMGAEIERAYREKRVR